MEAISEALLPYEGIVAKSAQWLTIIQMLSPMLMLNDMRKTKSTNGMPVVMFLFFLVFSALGLRFGQLINDEVSYNANVAGLGLSLLYVTAYFYYATPEEKSNEFKKLLFASAFTFTVVLYSKLEDPEKIEHRFGLIFTGLFYAFIMIPVFDTIKVFKEKSTRHLPLPMITTGTAVGLAWFLHGIIINSGFIILQNGVMLFISFVQLSCFLIYPSTEQPSLKKKQ